MDNDAEPVNFSKCKPELYVGPGFSSRVRAKNWQKFRA